MYNADLLDLKFDVKLLISETVILSENYLVRFFLKLSYYVK